MRLIVVKPRSSSQPQDNAQVSARAFDAESRTIDDDLALQLSEALTDKSLPYLSSQQQLHLANMIECIVTAEKHRRSMDENATRFMLFFQQYVLRSSQSKQAGSGLSWREVIWAFHSGSQDILIDFVSRNYSAKVNWEHARDSGMFMWITDANALVSGMHRNNMIVV